MAKTNKDYEQYAKRAHKKTNRDGTCLQGYIEIPYNTLVHMFGQPMRNDGYKVDSEWIVYTPVGVATIYNYKDGKNYCVKDGIPTKQKTEWHVGGHVEDVLTHISNAMFEYRMKNKDEEYSRWMDGRMEKAAARKN